MSLALSATRPASPVHAQPKKAAPAPRLTKAPVLLEFVEAPYPEAELAAPREATVILNIAISATGEVSAAQVTESAGEHFDAAALEAVQRFRFQPAEIDDKPAPVRITYRYAFAPPPPAATTGGFHGVVADRASAAPLAGVKISVDAASPVEGLPATHVEQLTAADGKFAFEELPLGTVHVTLSRSDLTPLATDETIEAGRVVEAHYDIDLPTDEQAAGESDDLEIVVKAPPQLVRQVVSTEVSSDEARRVPGTQGDVLKVVENLPGIARASAGSGEVVVWGAAPQDTRTYIGAVRVPMLYHFGGLRSVLHNDAVASVELVPGGYGAAYGRGLGGLVLVTRKDLPSDGLHGSAQLDVLDASLGVATPITDKVRFTVSGRRSHVADLGGLLSDQSFQQYFTLPDYYDGQARLHIDLSQNSSLQIGAMLSGDKQTRTQPSDNPALRSSDRRNLTFQRYDIAYRRQNADGSEVTISPWYGHDDSSRRTNFGGVPAGTQTESHLVGLRAQYRGQLADPLSATLGFDFEAVHSTTTRNGSITFPPREGDAYVFGRAPADQLNYDQWSTLIASAAAYGELDYAPFGDALHVVPGLRLEPYLIQAERTRPHTTANPDLKAFSHDIAVEPRLSVRFSPLRNLTVRLAGGLYRQPPLTDDLSAVFGNPTVNVSRGEHVLASVGYHFWEQWSVELAGFHTHSKDLVSRNPSANPLIAQALIQDGEGRSTGAQALIRKDKGKSGFFGWIAYTIMRSERRTPTTSPWRLFDYDQTHVLTAVGSYDIGAGFEFGLRARLASGYPRTPITGAYFNARTNRYEPVLGELNTIRIPMFFQLDARISKRFKIERTNLEIYLDVQNALDRDNYEELAYSPDYTQRRYIRGLPILPVLGARWEF